MQIENTKVISAIYSREQIDNMNAEAVRLEQELESCNDAQTRKMLAENTVRLNSLEEMFAEMLTAIGHSPKSGGATTSMINQE